jgi:hypothetical protein
MMTIVHMNTKPYHDPQRHAAATAWAGATETARLLSAETGNQITVDETVQGWHLTHRPEDIPACST